MEIQPQGEIEEMYLKQIAVKVWEIERLRRFRISTIEQAYGRALRNLLEQLLVDPGTIMPPPFIKGARAGSGLA